MNNKSEVVAKNIICKSRSDAFNGSLILGSLIFVLSFVLLACVLGNVEVTVNPLVPNMVL